MNLKSSGTIRLIKVATILLFGWQTVFSQTFFIENFGTAAVCDGGNQANGFVTASGTWTVLNTNTNDAFANEWYISAAEEGIAPTTCSGNSCRTNPLVTQRSLHIGNVTGSPSSILCLTGDCGALYDAGIGTAQVSTFKRAVSPVIDCSGQSNISLSINYIEGGDGTTDNGTVWYYDGTGWILLGDPPKTTACITGSEWSVWNMTLPATANNNPVVQLGFEWQNNDDALGSDPSFAIRAVTLSAGQPPDAQFAASDTVICAGDSINFTDQSANGPVGYQWTFFGGTPGVSSLPNPTGIRYNTPGSYTVRLIVTNASGSDTLVKTNYITVLACAAPVAAFSASDTVVCETNCISFSDQSLNGATSWLWLFPGSATPSSTQQNPQNVCYPVAGFYNVTLIATNSFGMDTLTRINYIDVDTCPRPEANFVASQTNICSNTCISFTDLSTNMPATWQWFFPGGNPSSSTVQNPMNICYASDGVFDVWLIVSNQYGRDTLILPGYISVISVPGSFISPDVSIYFGESTQLNSGGGISYQWIPATGLTNDTIPNPVASPAQTTTYTLLITDATGCISIKQVTVTILHISRVFVPSAFSPDGQNGNDVLFVRGNNIATMKFFIYNRWGEKIFESTDPRYGWDGTYQGHKLDPGVFVYTLQVSFTDGKFLNQNGNVTLIR